MAPSNQQKPHGNGFSKWFGTVFGLVTFLLLQTSAVVWWAATMNGTVNYNSERIRDNNERMRENRDSMTRLETRVKKLEDKP